MKPTCITLALLLVLAPLATAQHNYTQEAVAADHEIASMAGAEMLAKGGNAIDAAVATSLTLSVVRPYSCGIGGGGFMLIWLADPAAPTGGQAVAVSYRERAPNAVNENYYKDLEPSASLYGGHAVAIPGTIHGLISIHEFFGTLPPETVLAPALRAAEQGFTTDANYMATARGLIKKFEDNPDWQTRFSFIWKRYLKEGNVALGDTITSPEQAAALRLIGQEGMEAFYLGDIANAIVETVQADGGAMTLDDLALYEMTIADPIITPFRRNLVLTMPPPSSGGIAIAQILGILDQQNAVLMPKGSDEYAHTLIEAMKHAFADRAQWLGDADFVDVPTERLTSKFYIAQLAKHIDPDHTQPPESYGTRDTPAPPPDDDGTSHFSIIDKWGNAVACTETINTGFGSLLAVEKYGIILNNEMDDFLTRPGEPNVYGLRQSDRNLPAPGKRPLSSMSPTIVLDDNYEVQIIAGASGGPRIITGTIQVILNILFYDMTAEEAVTAPRLHHQWLPNAVYVEDALKGSSITKDLKSRGHELRDRDVIGNVQVISKTRTEIQAASDPRKGGKPAGR